jgi:hypothetical protein
MDEADLAGPILGPTAPVSAGALTAGGPVDFIARRYDGATYVWLSMDDRRCVGEIT